MDKNIEARLAVMEEQMEKLEHRLFGNGQPGVLDKIETRLKNIEERMGKLNVAIALLAGGGGAGLGAILQTLFGAG